MIRLVRPAVALFAALVVMPVFGSGPALADGAASTRNIIFGTAAAAAGTLLIINHNKKVHEKYAEDARRQAQLETERNNIRAAYESERQAYNNEAALVASYQHEVAIQHDQVVRDRSEISSLRHQLASARPPQHVAAAPKQTTVAHVAPKPASAEPLIAYGWGTL
jgi:hypothetical protein